MSCSKQHGPQAFIGFIADSTGETVSQQDWHDLREMAEELGGDMSREQVSPQEAIATLKALDAKLKAEAVSEKKAKDSLRTGSIPNEDDAIEEARKQFHARAASNPVNREEIRKRIFAAFESASPPPTPPSTPSKPSAQAKASTPSQEMYAQAEKELLSAKVTRGTLTVMRMFVEIGVKPLLAMIRAHREEQRRIKRSAKDYKKMRKRVRSELYGSIW